MLLRYHCGCSFHFRPYMCLCLCLWQCLCIHVCSLYFVCSLIELRLSISTLSILSCCVSAVWYCLFSLSRALWVSLCLVCFSRSLFHSCLFSLSLSPYLSLISHSLVISAYTIWTPTKHPCAHTKKTSGYINTHSRLKHKNRRKIRRKVHSRSTLLFLVLRSAIQSHTYYTYI